MSAEKNEKRSHICADVPNKTLWSLAEGLRIPFVKKIKIHSEFTEWRPYTKINELCVENSVLIIFVGCSEHFTARLTL